MQTMISEQAKSSFVTFVVEHNLRNATIFVDNGITEALRYLGGLSFLVDDLEMTHVMNISNYLPEAHPEQKLHRQCTQALFLLSSFLWDSEATVLRAAKLCGVKELVIGCTVCEAAHAAHPLAEQLGEMDFRDMGNLMSSALTKMFALNPQKVADLSEIVTGEKQRVESMQLRAEQSSPARVVIDYVPLHIGAIFENQTIALRNFLNDADDDNYSVPDYLPSIFSLSDPDCARVFPLQCSHIKDSSTKYDTVEQIEVSDIPVQIRCRFKLLAWNLAGLLFKQLQVDSADSIFAVGKTSRLLAHNVLDCLSGLKEEDNAEVSFPKASLVLVDRTLDLAAPLSRKGGIVQRILETLPRAGNGSGGPYASNKAHLQEIAVNLPNQALPLVEVAGPTHLDVIENALPAVSNFKAQLPPALFPGSGLCAGLLHCMACLPEAEGHAILRKALLKAVKDCNGPMPPDKKRGMGAEIMALITSLVKADAVFRNSSLVQLSLAFIEAMQRTAAVSKSSWDEICSIQKVQTQMVREGPCDTDLVLQLIECLKCHSHLEEQKSGPVLTFGDILELSLHGLVLNGSLEDGIGMLLSGAFVNAIMSVAPSKVEELSKLPWLPDAVFKSLKELKSKEANQEDNAVDEEEDMLRLQLEIEDIVQEVLIKRLQQAANSRASLKSPLLSNPLPEESRSETLVGRLTELLLDPAEPEIPDLEKISGAFEQLGKVGMGLIRSFGLGSRFAGSERLPRPTDQSTVIICVVGGLSFKEVQEVSYHLQRRASNDSCMDSSIPNILVCGTTLANSTFTCEQVFCHDNINQ